MAYAKVPVMFLSVGYHLVLLTDRARTDDQYRLARVELSYHLYQVTLGPGTRVHGYTGAMTAPPIW